MARHRRCYVLGAGFSAPCGFPLANALSRAVFSHAYESGKDHAPDLWDGYFDDLRLVLPEYDFDSRWPDLEYLLTVLDELQQYRRAYEKPDLGPIQSSPERLHHRLLRHLVRLVNERSERPSMQGWQHVRAFVEKLDCTRDRIISFNWDWLIEGACYKLGREYAYREGESNGVILFKPHGSVNWGEVAPAESCDTDCPPGTMQFVDAGLGTHVVYSKNPWNTANAVLAKTQRSLIVPPSVRKSYKSEWIRDQWNFALNSLRAAEEVVIIGYSLPEHDLRARLLLRFGALGIGVRSRKPMTLVDVNASGNLVHYREQICEWIAPVCDCWTNWLAEGA